ncbi:hypothetical protein M011DRAFT_457476 [Sporormia fimetaria CBS 119925]|uniref:F-box domain-containing protein n=1 Tax=Sporormia fimetaria CBS 119925 TaxID=1340428 RepID=A0A6A6VDX9_9PLEO|nr:hypothetical protein M011DRAFT_457476 [Sporormia fimetaria CBS 119925]
MDTLPQELFDYIFRFIDRQTLRNTLTVSKQFRLATEQSSGVFEKVELNATSEEKISKFLKVYSNQRFRLLRQIKVRTGFPYIDYDYNLPCRENLDDLRAKDETFTLQIQRVFAAISDLQSLSDQNREFCGIHLTIFTPTSKVHPHNCRHRQYSSWRIHLLSPRLLPQLGSVRTLTLDQEWGSGAAVYGGDTMLNKLDLRVIVDLVVKLPRLEMLNCMIGCTEWSWNWETKPARHYSKDWAGPRRDSHHDFAKAVQSANLPTTLKKANLNFIYPLREAQGTTQHNIEPDLIYPYPVDPFSSALSLFCSNLRRLQLRVIADQGLFLPADWAQHDWPHLEALDVMLLPVTPSGLWYFEGPRGEGRVERGFRITEQSYPPLEATSEDEDMDWLGQEWGLRKCDAWNDAFRIAPSPDILEPMLSSFATAAA